MSRKGQIADKYLERTRFFSMSRKPYQEGPKTGRTSGKFSPKSGLIFVKAGPKYTTLTPQQKKIAAAGKACAEKMRGVTNYEERTKIAGECIRNQFK